MSRHTGLDSFTPSTPRERSSEPLALNTSGFVHLEDWEAPEDTGPYGQRATSVPNDPFLSPVARPGRHLRTVADTPDPEDAPEVVYEDRDNETETHGVRFQRDTVVSFGRREAFRVNRHGVPVFTPGWTAGRSARNAWARTLVLVLGCAVMVLASVWAVHHQVGTDPEYHRLNDTGIHATATITDIDQGTNAAGLVSSIYTAAWSGDGASGELVIDTTTAPLVSGERFVGGDRFDVLVDREDTANWVYADKKPLLGKVNPVNLMPLIIGVALAAAAVASGHLAARLSLLAARSSRGRQEVDIGPPK